MTTMDKMDNEVLRPDEYMARISWPDLHQTDVPCIEIDGCLILCAGFEDRSIDGIRRIRQSGARNFSVGVIRYLPEQAENQPRLDELHMIGQESGLEITEFIYDRENPSGIGEKLRAFTESFAHIFVDISGMSRLLIVQTLVALINNHMKKVSILYGEAEEYYPTKRRVNRDRENGNTAFFPSYLSSGVFEIATTPELGSTSMLSEAIRLVAFPSFDPTQLAILIQELQPTYAEIIHGIPPRRENTWRTRAIHDLNKRTLDDLQWKREHNASTLDYREILNILLDIYAERSAFDRLVISPTGSKMQAVAIGLLRSMLHDVQIVYPTPQLFSTPNEYTSGLRQLYQIDLSPNIIFGDTF